VTSTISAPLSAITAPYCEGLSPSSPICTGNDDRCCMNTTAKQKVSSTKVRNTRSRSTSAIEPGRSPSATTTSGRDSGTLR
jgi:hypothetical protein